MGPPVKERELPRQTYEIVRDSQALLIDRIQEKIDTNSKLRKNEFISFFNLYQKATYGIGHRVALNYTDRMPGSEGWSVDHIVLNMLKGEDDNPISSGYDHTQWQWKLEPGEVWTAVLERLLGVLFGMALEAAIRMSPERDTSVREAGLHELGVDEWLKR